MTTTTTGIAGAHARAEVEGTALRTAAHSQAKTIFRNIAAAVIILSLVYYGYQVFTDNRHGGVQTAPSLGELIILGVFFYGGYHVLKDPDATLPKKFFRLGVGALMLAGAITYIFGPTAIPNIHQGAKNWYESKSSNAKTTGDTQKATAMVPGCQPVKLIVEPGETVLFERNVFCRNLDWLREDGPTLFVTFEGNAGTDSREWESGTRMPVYDGIVKTAKIAIAKKGKKSVLVEFFYNN